jgi:uncharacterized protein (TIGR02996 family)
MTTEASFLHTIQEAPYDLSHRLVYADWLAEKGEEARAEYVRLQCRLAQLDEKWDVEHSLVTARAERLWNIHGEKWVAKDSKTFGKDVSREYQRGLPESAEVQNVPGCIKNAAKALASPLVSVKVMLENAKQLAFLRLPELAQVRELELCQVTGEAADALAGASLPNLRKLTLNEFQCEPDQLLPLYNSPLMDQLEELNIWDFYGLSNALFLSRGRPKKLRRLFIYAGILSGEGPERMVSADWAGLEELHLEFLNLRDRGTEQVYASPHLGSLRAFSVDSTSNEHTVALLTNPALRRVEKLVLGGLHRSRAAPMLEALSALDWPALRYLHLKGNDIRGLGAAVAKCPCGPRLVGLNLEELYLEKPGVTALAGGDFGSLRWLGLRRATMGDAGLKALLAAPWLANTESLDLRENHLGPAAGKQLAASKALANVRLLDLSGNSGMGDESLVPLLKSNAMPRCQVLDLANTNAGDESMKALAGSPLAKQLVVLMLNQNDVPLSEEGPLVLEGKCPNLQAIWWDISDVGDDPERQKKINRALGEGVFDFHRHHED